MIRDDYDWKKDALESWKLSIAERRKAGLIGGRFAPRNDEEREIMARAARPAMQEEGGITRTRRYQQARMSLPVVSREPSPLRTAILTLQNSREKFCGAGGGDLRRILMAVGQALNVPYNDLVSPRRFHRFVEARFVYYAMARQLTACSLPQIGRACGNRDHSTVWHGLRMVARYPQKFAALMALVRVEEREG